MSEQLGVIPGTLDRTTLDSVGLRMITPRIGKPTPQPSLFGKTFLLDGPNRKTPDCDYSLTSQIPELLQAAPDAIVFTANSAVPVGDVFRGLYEALHQSLPKLAVVNANHDHETMYLRDPQQMTTEIERLGRNLAGLSNVAVVDQHTLSGRTTERSRILLAEAGKNCRLVIMGDWYTEAQRYTLDIEAVTSTFADEMWAIGHRVGEVALANLQLAS